MAAELGEFAPGQLIDPGILLGGLPYASSASDSTVVMKEDGHIEHSKHHISNGHNKKEKKNKEKVKKVKNNNNKQSPKKRPLTASASDLRHSSGSGHIAIGVPMSARDPEPSSHDKTTTNPRKHSSPAAVRRDTGGSNPAQGSSDQQQKTPERRASGLTTLPALVAPAGSRRSPKGSGSAREAGDHVNTNEGNAGRRAGEAENEDDEEKERESPGRRKVGLQANLRRLSVRLTNVPNIFRCLSCVVRMRFCCVAWAYELIVARVLFAAVNLRVSSRCGRKRKARWSGAARSI